MFFSSEIEDGDTHAHYNLPVIIGGGLSGAVPTGTHLRVAQQAPLSGLFLSLLAGLDVPTARFGDDGTHMLVLGSDHPETVLGRALQRSPTL